MHITDGDMETSARVVSTYNRIYHVFEVQTSLLICVKNLSPAKSRLTV